jgi:hypothetical protein
VFAGRPPALERHGDRTPSFAVMRCRLKRRTHKTTICRHFPTGQADAGTRTPDPIITRYCRRPRQSAWLSRIGSPDRLRVPRVCQSARRRGCSEAVRGTRRNRRASATATDSVGLEPRPALHPPPLPRDDIALIIGSPVQHLRRRPSAGRSRLAHVLRIGRRRLRPTRSLSAASTPSRPS